MLIEKRNNNGAEEFWAERERDLGKAILNKCLGRIIHTNDTATWGLFYNTDDTLYFQTFASNNWASLLFTGGKGINQNELIEIPLALIDGIQQESRKGGLFRFFRSTPKILMTLNQPGGGGKEIMTIDMEDRGENFMASLPLPQKN